MASRLIKNLSIYGLGGMLNQAISFLLLPLYTRILSPEDFGSFVLVNLSSTVVGLVFGYMVGSGFTRRYFDSIDDSFRLRLFGTAVVFTIVTAVPALLLLLVCADPLAALVFHFEGAGLYLRLVAAATMFSTLSTLFYNLLMVKQSAKAYVTINVASLVATIGLTLFCLFVLRWSVLGLFIAQAVGRFAELAMLVYACRKGLRPAFAADLLRSMLRFSLPLLPAQVFFFALSFSDRFFLQRYGSLANVGQYAVGAKLAAVLPLFIVIPLKAWGPYIFDLSRDRELCRSKMAEFLKYYMAGAMLVALVVALLSREVLVIMAKPAYFGAEKVVFLLCISNVAYGLMNVVAFGYHVTNRTWIMSVIDIGGSLCNVGLNALLVPRYGMLGAAVSSTLAYLLIICCYLLGLSKVFPVRFAYARVLMLVGLATGTSLLGGLVERGIVTSVLIKVSLLGAFAFAVLRGGYFEESESARLGAMARSLVGSGRAACSRLFGG